MRVVFDTNVFVSALVVPGGRADEALQRVMDGTDTLLVSRAILDELLLVLARTPGKRPLYGSAASDARCYISMRRQVMDWKQYITSDPGILHGTVCLSGTRVPVSVVLDNLAANETPERILQQYPSLKPEHISAAIAYAADLARERIVPMPA